MVKNLIGLLIAISLFGDVNAQFVLNGNVSGYRGRRVYMFQFKANDQVITDSASCLNGNFKFNLKPNTSPGVYRIILEEKLNSNFFDEDPKFIDVILNKENVSFSTSFDFPIDSMRVFESGENEILYRFLKSDEIYQMKLKNLSQLFGLYTSKDVFYSSLSHEFGSLQNIHLQECKSLIKEHQGTIAASVIQLMLIPEVEQPSVVSDMKLYIRNHYFDLKKFEDPRLINSPYISNCIIEYMGLYRNQGATQEQQEDLFIQAVDSIMNAVSAEPQIYDFMLNFLINGFQKFQMEKILVHISENYINGGCETASKITLQKRLAGYEKMAPGKKVPDISLKDINGKQLHLYDLNNEYTLIVFWASWCPHCTSFLKQLSKWYPSKAGNIEVFSVSIDSTRLDWEEHSMINNFPWINTYCEGGWEGKAAKDFNVYATPTLFIIDKNHQIIGKPLTFKEFKKELDLLYAVKNEEVGTSREPR